jgi:DNA helicase-2/ATP-dependent DNA helicase PcrA
MEGAPRAEVKAAANSIARAKDYFLSPDDPELDLIDHRKTFRAVYAKYEERLAKIGNVDFGDLIKKPVELLRSQSDVARRFRERFSVILVDEYQDANVAQSQLLRELYSPGAYLCVVGDDDQSIYRFRGAEVKNILEFPDTFEGADIIRLERNYRSTAPILRTASSVVDHNTSRLGKTLKAERGAGETPVLYFLRDQDREAEHCANLIQKSAKSEGVKNDGEYSDWAVTYRNNAQSLSFETEFLRRRIPYRVVGSLKFYEREEVKDILALLSLIMNPRDEIAFRRMVNKPSRGVGPASVGRIIAEAMMLPNQEAGNLALAAKNFAPNLSAKARSGIDVFLKAIEAGRATLMDEGDSVPEATGPNAENPVAVVKGRQPLKPGKELRAGEGLSTCVVRLAEESGIAEYHLTEDEITGNQRLSNLQEVANAASLYAASTAGLLEFLEHIELDRSMEEATGAGKDAVTLITLHNTKGLEFRKVIMTGVEQGIFPREDKHNEDLEEERRLFYVGATRAMDKLYIISCSSRRRYGRTEPMEPSLFLREIDREALKVIDFVSSSLTAGFSPGKSLKTSDGRWALGDKVFHDDHGYGSITQIVEGEDGPVIRVIFETGYEKRFLSLYQSSKLTRIGVD